MSLATGQTFWDALLPSLIVAAAAMAVLPWLDRNRLIVRAVAIGICLALMWRYLLWRVSETLPPVGFTADFLVGIVFLAVEALCIAGTSASWLFLMRTCSRSQQADFNTPWLKALPRPPRVDVLICTYNEDEKILERTIVGAQALEYENFRVWVCDDGRRAWLQALCERLSCGYLTRPTNEYAKAGNINSALRHLATLPERPVFITILDADFVVHPHFLQRTLPLMRDERVGIVQTPQHFFNPDPIQSNLAISQLWPDEQRFFFDTVLASKDAWGGAFCCGTSSLIRFDVLVEIGGFPTDSVTEDYLLTLRFKEAAFKTIYLNEPLSLGLAPEGLKEYVTQRSRWCLGFMQIFRGPSGPLHFGNRLSVLDRVMLLDTFVHWSMTYTFRIFSMLVPAIYLLFDVQAVYAHLTDAVNYAFPYFVSQLILIAWLTRGRVLPIMTDLTQVLCATEIVRSTIAGLFKPQGHKFKVTPKGGDRSVRFVQWSMLRVFLGYIALNAIGIFWAFVADNSRPLADASALALFWSWYNLIVLTLACFVAIEEGRRREADRFRARGRFQVAATGQVAALRVLDISVSGIAFWGRCPVARGDTVQVTIDGTAVPGVVVREWPHSFAIHFKHTEQTRAHLIRHVFSGRYGAAVDRIKPAEIAFGVLSRIWR